SSRRRHTRFSRDWSSDVCSSDLLRTLITQKCQARLLSALPTRRQPGVLLVALEPHSLSALYLALLLRERGQACVLVHAPVPPARSEERRVGKECVSRVWSYERVQ